MEIEVNEYVRTKNKGIQKIAYIRPNATVNKYAYFIGYDNDGCRINGILKTTDIVKHSKNIIDLIEVGDYVNGVKVDKITKNYITVGGNTFGVKNLTGIKSILTKEQYGQNSYKI